LSIGKISSPTWSTVVCADGGSGKDNLCFTPAHMAALTAAATSFNGNRKGCSARARPSISKRRMAFTMAASISGSKAVWRSHAPLE
jgi:hypothetical protein